MARTLYVNYAREVNGLEVAAFDVAVVDPGARVELAAAKAAGTTVLAYLSAVEVAPDAAYRDRVRNEGHRILAHNPEWNSDLPDISTGKWTALLADLADEAAARGFDGFFLDTMDAADTLAEKFPDRAGEFRDGLVAAVGEIRRRHPGRKIVLNRGFSVLPRLRGVVDGVLAESLFSTYDFSVKKYAPVVAADSAWLLEKLRGVAASGLPVYVVDYADPGDPAAADAVAEKIRAEGFVPFISTPELDGQLLAPVRRVPRKVAVLYGRTLEPGEPRFWPADTWAAQGLVLPLEWLGYVPVFFNAEAGELPGGRGDEFAAYVFDAFTDWGEPTQKRVLEWFAKRPAKSAPVLVFGKLPFDGRYATIFGGLLGMSIDTRTTSTLNSPEGIRMEKSPILAGEIPPRPIPSNYPVVVAPKGARVLASLAFRVPGDLSPKEFDAVFLAPWGGAVLNPFLRFERPDNISLSVVDIFAFLGETLRGPAFPAPDPTTRDGLRLVFSHVDADGFSNFSAVEKGRLSSEIIRDHIYKAYPLPITSSIIESEIRGYLKRQAPGDSEKLTRIAKDIFALPNIQIASHTYSHPFFWMHDDKTETLYEVQALELGVQYDLGRIDPEREICGSVEYIRRELAPPGKPVDLILWSGNCRPGPEALAVADAMGIENLNGGDTVVSRSRPGVASVAPLAMPWDDRLQVNAAIQNEMLFTGGFEGPRWGGYTNVIQTFERTGAPRRLKPVGIYYHIFMGDRLESLNSLKAVYDWALARPLQATTAARYARSVREANRAVIFTHGTDRWIVVAGSECRTFRLPSCKPDFAASQNLVGANPTDGQLYLAAGKSPRTVIALAGAPPPHIHLKESTAEANVEAFGPREIRISASDFRPVRITLAGFAPDARVPLVVDGKPAEQVTSPDGELTVNGGKALSFAVSGAPLP